MTSLGLIAKTVENLRNLQLLETLNPDHEVKKKEKIANCLALTTGISLANVKAAPQVLNLSIETLLCLCDDNDSDVRTVADECLNKIIRAIADSYVLKVQFELYREIKRNGAARCLRAALWRFGLLSHMIRPVKAKVFASQLTPCILDIAKRREDIVIEVLSQSLPLILKTLGHYIPDKDIQVLLKAFFQNLISNEAVLRRASANMILTTCLNCRKPQQFMNHVIEQLIDILSQTTEECIEEAEGREERINAVLGVFGCLRLIIPQIDASSNFIPDLNEDHILDHYICIYDFCLFYAKFYSNHNVINAALETLAQLLQNPPKNVVTVLLSSEGIPQRINKLKERGKQWSSKMSLTTTIMSEDQLETSSNLFESDLMDIPEITPKVEKWMTEMSDVLTSEHSKVQVTKADGSDSSQNIDAKDLEDYSGLVIGSLENEDVEIQSNASSDVGKFEKPLETTSLPSCSDLKDDEEDFGDDGTTTSIVSSHELSLVQFMSQRDLDIGNLLDGGESALCYCCRFLASSFLLAGSPGQLMPDKLCRVSVKSLALACIGNALRLRPETLLDNLVKVSKKDEEPQMLADVLMLAEHSDPQIRGNIMLLVGSFLQGVFAHDRTCSEYLHSNENHITLENLIELILKGLKDESATTCRHTLTAIGAFLPSLLESEDSSNAILILKALPRLAKNPYFLVKIKLTEIISELPYVTIEHVSSDLNFQKSIINVLLKLLSDPDQRVRKAAASAITKIIPRLYYGSPHEDPVTRKASLYTDRYVCSAIAGPALLFDNSHYTEHRLLLDSLSRPYDAPFQKQRQYYSPQLEEALSRVLSLLADGLLVYESRHATLGYCEALCELSQTYLTSLYSRGWDIPSRLSGKKPVKKAMAKGEAVADGFLGISNEALSPMSSTLFSQTIIMLGSSPLSFDLSAHRNLLILAGNLVSGIAFNSFRSKEPSTTSSNTSSNSNKGESDAATDFKYWMLFKDKQTAKNMEQLLIHVMRLLNIFQHVVEDLPSPIQPAKSSLPSLPSAQSLSPKRKLLSTSSDQSSKSKSNSADKSPEQQHHRPLSFRFSSKEQLGSLTGHSHYLRLYEILRAAHSNYRVTLEQEASELYLGLLNATLQVLSQILEVATLNEAGRVAEEILHYLQSTVLLSSTTTVQCVRQLLKSLFGTNLIARWPDVYEAQYKQQEEGGILLDDVELMEERRGFYDQCFQKPAKLMNEMIKSVGRNCRGGNEPKVSQRLIPALHRKEDRKLPSILKILSRNSDQSSVGSFIRLFEPLVIKSLIQYTISNSIALQCQVLMLLSQLIHLHINYCLMDSDKIFIGFVMKQFEFIEEGHIGDTEILLPKIFDFLVRLSYEKYHSKIIIGVPKIIQLCDGLMASGQPPLTHCIPALVPVVEELFLASITPANLNEEKELETTREVLISMMLRLAEYPQIVELLAKCLTESRLSNDGNGEEKWRRWSRQIMDVILPMLSSRKLRVETKEAYFALVKLFSVVSPTVFRPVDPLLKLLFTMPPPVGNDLISGSLCNSLSKSKSIMEFKRWISMVNVTLLSLISYAREETMLARLSDVAPTIVDLPEVLLMPDSARRVSGDPLNVSGLQEPFSMSPERVLARFVFRVIGCMSSAFMDLYQSANLKVLDNSDKDDYVIHQFASFLQICIHMFETGSHCKVANDSMQLIQGENIPDDERLSLKKLNEVMIKIGVNCPVLAYQWTYILTLLSYNNMSFWSKVMGSQHDLTDDQSQQSINRSISSVNKQILERASTILFCDYVCENVSNESERLSWLLTHRVDTTVRLVDEAPVRELLAVAVHREPQLSGLFLRCVVERSESWTRQPPSFVKRLLLCLEGAHQSQSGQLLMVLVPGMLSSKYLVLSRMAAKIASRRVEVLLALGREEAILQLSKDDFKKMVLALNKKGLAKKHGALVGLLNKLATTHYVLEPIELDHSKPFDLAEVKNIKLDRTWYLSQVKSRCCEPCVSYGCFESAWLLSRLDLDECLEILTSKDFKVKLLYECVVVGTRLTFQAAQKWELDGTVKPNDTTESTLYSATKRCLVLKVSKILEKLPKLHEVFVPSEKHTETTVSNYSSALKELLENSSYRESIFSLGPAITAYFNSLAELSRQLSAEYEPEFTRFAILCLETCHQLVHKDAYSIHELELGLKCARSILREPTAARALGAADRRSWVCSAAAALMGITEHLIDRCEDDEVPELSEDCSGLREALASKESREYGLACLRMAGLVRWLQKRRQRGTSIAKRINDIPKFFAESLEGLIVSIARQPLVNSFVLMPPLLWKHDSTVVGTGPTKCEFALFSSEPNYMPELDVLEEFIFRLTLLGWTSRQQFEEIWMALLGVLNASQLQQSESESDSTSTSLGDGQVVSLAVQALANLLAQTLILPCPGDPSNGAAIRHPRDPQLSLQKKSTQRLFAVQDLLLWKYAYSDIAVDTGAAQLEHLFQRGNLEPRVADSRHSHAYGQLSVSYLWAQCALHEDKLNSTTLRLKARRDEALAAASLDVDSCLRFLLELYASWLAGTPGSKLPLRLLHEVARSLLLVSELFVERAQFQWMLESCLEIWRLHSPEDEMLRRHLVVAVCKASAVLTPLDTETLEKVKRLLDASLKCSSLSMRIASLHGTLYLLQSAVLANCDETMSAVRPLAIEYIQRYLNIQDSSKMTNQSEEHQCILWALVFFLLEHTEDTPSDVEAPAVLELILTLVTTQNISTSLHRMLLQGLERLVATKSVIGKVLEQVVKISIERIRQLNPVLSLPALQLFLTCMYTDTADRFNNSSSNDQMDEAAIAALEPEIERSIERSSVFFDKIKKGYPAEVEILCAVLAEVVVDFFPPLEILTKVIGEFLSPHQPHPRLMSAVVFKVCERACNSTQLGLLQTWVVFSIQNFIQSLPLIMSTWCLSCFFISTSTNPWLRALFPHVQSRIGKYEHEDKKTLCLAAVDFYSELTNESQKKTFIKTFEDAAKNIGTPFTDILASF